MRCSPNRNGGGMPWYQQTQRPTGTIPWYNNPLQHKPQGHGHPGGRMDKNPAEQTEDQKVMQRRKRRKRS